jgi:hypothetical protein
MSAGQNVPSPPHLKLAPDPLVADWLQKDDTFLRYMGRAALTGAVRLMR